MNSETMRTILIGTTNDFKYNFYGERLSLLEEYSVIFKKLSDLESKSSRIEETMDNLELNAINKAVTYARQTGLVTIADDAGTFIPALNNEPGIAARRWGGKLPEDISDKDWESYFLERMKEANITETECIREFAVACSDPKGNYRVFKYKLLGKIKIPGSGHYMKRSPLSSYFFIEQCNKFQSDMTEEDIKIIYSDLKIKLEEILKQMIGL